MDYIDFWLNIIFLVFHQLFEHSDQNISDWLEISRDLHFYKGFPKEFDPRILIFLHIFGFFSSFLKILASSEIFSSEIREHFHFSWSHWKYSGSFIFIRVSLRKSIRIFWFFSLFLVFLIFLKILNRNISEPSFLHTFYIGNLIGFTRNIRQWNSWAFSFLHERPTHPLKIAKYRGVPQHQPKSYLCTCELTPFSPENWPQILGRLIYSASVLPDSTSIKRVIFLSFLREIRRLHSLVNHLETALRGASETPGPRPTCFQRPGWCWRTPQTPKPFTHDLDTYLKFQNLEYDYDRPVRPPGRHSNVPSGPCSQPGPCPHGGITFLTLQPLRTWRSWVLRTQHR